MFCSKAPYGQNHNSSQAPAQTKPQEGRRELLPNRPQTNNRNKQHDSKIQQQMGEWHSQSTEQQENKAQKIAIKILDPFKPKIKGEENFNHRYKKSKIAIKNNTGDTHPNSHTRSLTQAVRGRLYTKGEERKL
ncbi:hypothetical protein U1Q18_022847 [Sarracenia purpurea var. burkii]